MERRANAFAAELLLPQKGILETLGPVFSRPDDSEIGTLMDKFGVGHETCFRHYQLRSCRDSNPITFWASTGFRSSSSSKSSRPSASIEVGARTVSVTG